MTAYSAAYQRPKDRHKVETLSSELRRFGDLCEFAKYAEIRRRRFYASLGVLCDLYL